MSTYLHNIVSDPAAEFQTNQFIRGDQTEPEIFLSPDGGWL